MRKGSEKTGSEHSRAVASTHLRGLERRRWEYDRSVSVCAYCGAELENPHGLRRYCGRRCYKRAEKKRIREGLVGPRIVTRPAGPALAPVEICGCGLDYLSVELEHECDSPRLG